MMHPRNAPPAGADAERAAFLRDLRALRDQAGLQTRDLAARAHYPEDTLQTAEDGPALPSLPVLEAYVRGCGARPSDWEDRWRRLTLSEEGELGSALPTRAPTANRPPTRGASPGPAGLSAAEQAALTPGLARVAAGLGPTTVATDARSWFARPDMAASGSAAEVALAFKEAYRMLAQRIGAFTALPIRSLDRMSLQHRLSEIGLMDGATETAAAKS